MTLASIQEKEEKRKWSRKILGGIRCVRDHGIGYTLRYLKKKKY